MLTATFFYTRSLPNSTLQTLSAIPGIAKLWLRSFRGGGRNKPQRRLTLWQKSPPKQGGEGLIINLQRILYYVL